MTTDRWLALTVHLPPAEEPDAAPPGGAGGAAGVGHGTSWPANEGPDRQALGPLPPGFDRELIPQLLLELGGWGVHELGDSFTTYLPPPDDLDALLQETDARLVEAGIRGAEVRWAWQPQEDWQAVWKRGLGPRRVTDRLLVAPTWDLPEVREGEILIVIDPGMAFGTAEHATTRGCLRLLDKRIGNGDRVVDVGSGSGILSIAAARLGAMDVLAMEMDPVSCEVAEENVVANGVEDRVRVRVAEVQAAGPLPESPFDGVVANIQRTILLPLLSSFRGSLTEGGWLILSGILTEERAEVLAATAHHGFNLEEEDREDEWWSGAFTRPATSP